MYHVFFFLASKQHNLKLKYASQRTDVVFHCFICIFIARKETRKNNVTSKRNIPSFECNLKA